MTHKSILSMIAVLMLLVSVSGCLDVSRHNAAHLRWERTMDRARIQAARQKVEDGQLNQAERLLEECDQCKQMPSDLAEQAEQLREQIQSERNRYAKVDSPPEQLEQTVY